jgi:hypothetical protein
LIIIILIFLIFFWEPFSPGAEFTTYYVKYEVHSKESNLAENEGIVLLKKL